MITEGKKLPAALKKKGRNRRKKSVPSKLENIFTQHVKIPG